MSFPTAVHAQAIEAWSQLFSGAPFTYSGRGLAVGTSGNVYVGGSSGDTSVQEALTVAYSSEGEALWTNYYAVSGSAMPRVASVAMDSAENVFVTGGYVLPPSSARCATLKYSQAGVPMWTNVYNVADKWGSDLAVDPDGNVCVLASSSASGAAIIKYSNAGAQLWAKTFSCKARAMAVDSDGNVYMTGDVDLPGIVTLKYSNTGTLLWTKYYNTGYISANIRAMALDHSGNVVVTGALNINNEETGLLIKYSSAGLPMWTNCVTGGAVAIDDSGNIYVADTSLGAGNSSLDYLTVKYSSAGVPVWTNRYDGPGSWYEEPKAITLDASGNVYVTGNALNLNTSLDARYSDVLTVAYSSGGALLWTKRFNGPANETDWAQAVAADASGNIYVRGFSQTGDSAAYYYDLATIKYVTPPIITRQPASCTNAVGTSASFIVEVAGSAPFSYQWRRGGTNLVDEGNISGVTTTNSLIANVQPADAAGYIVVVTNAYGSVTSIVAQLTVVVPPNPGRFTNLSYSPTMGFSFIFRDATVGQPYRIQRSPSAVAGSWTDWQSFNYNGPVGFLDFEATGAERRFYRAVSP
jgi:hypothetical protein